MRGADYDDEQWELYHLDRDFSESRDLAAAEPRRLRQLVDLWWAEAGRAGVLPLDDRGLERYLVPKPRPVVDRTRFEYYRGAVVPTEGMPNIRNRSYTITAHIDRPRPGADGVLVACGDSTIGYVFLIVGDTLIHDYNCAGDHVRLVSNTPVPTGRVCVRYRFQHRGSGAGTSEISIENRVVATAEVERTLTSSFASVGLCVGHSASRAVCDAYVAPFPFAGEIDRLLVDLDTD